MLDNFFDGALGSQPGKNSAYTDAYGVTVRNAQDVINSDFLPFAITDQNGKHVLTSTVVNEFFPNEEDWNKMPGLLQSVATIELLINAAHGTILGRDVASSETIITMLSNISEELIANGLSYTQVTQAFVIAAINVANIHHSETDEIN